MYKKIEERYDVDKEHVLVFPENNVKVYFLKEKSSDMKNEVLKLLLGAYEERMKKLA